MVSNDNENSNGDDEQMIKVREIVDDDNSILKVVGQPLLRREFFDLNKLLERRQSSGFTTTQRQFQDLMLKAHNTYRARHCVSSLQLDDGINRSAQNYAEYLARIDQMVHSNTNGLGENLFWKWSSNPFKTISGE
jgi:uncharacterized protein YkwD